MKKLMTVIAALVLCTGLASAQRTFDRDVKFNQNVTFGSNSADTFELKATTVVIADTVTSLFFSTHSNSGAGAQGTMRLDGTNKRVCISCDSDEEPEATLQILDGALRLGTGSTFGTTAGEDDLQVEGSAEILGALTLGASATKSTHSAAGALNVHAGFVGNDSGGDNDSRIEGDTETDLLYVDAGNERVAIGTAAPSAKLDVQDGKFNLTDTDVDHGLTTRAPTQTYLQMEIGDNTKGGAIIEALTDANDANPLIIRGTFGNTDPTDTLGAVRIRGARQSGTDRTNLSSGETLMLIEESDGTVHTSFISGTQRVGIATADPQSNLDVSGTAQFGTATQSSFTAAGLLSMGNGAGLLSLTKAQLQARTPTQAGEVYYCSDCSNSVNGVVSTGTAVSQFDSFGVGGTAWH